MNNQEKISLLAISTAVGALALSIINVSSINRISTEQASRTKKVYRVDSTVTRIANLERTIAVNREKLEKRRVWMEGVQADIVASGSDRFTMTNFRAFIDQLQELNNELKIPKLDSKRDGIVLPQLPKDQE